MGYAGIICVNYIICLVDLCSDFFIGSMEFARRYCPRGIFQQLIFNFTTDRHHHVLLRNIR